MTRLLATAIVIWCTLPAVARAAPKVALGPIEDQEVQDAVADAIDSDELTLVGPEKVTRAIDKLGLDAEDMSAGDVKKLGREIDADAVLLASLSTKSNGHEVLHFRIYVHGKKQKGFKIEFGSAASKKFKKALHDKLVEKLADIGGNKDDDDDSADNGDKRDKHADSDDGDKKHGDDDKHADSDDGDKKHGDDDKHADSDDGDKKHGDDDSDDDHGHKGHKRTAQADDDDDTEIHAKAGGSVAATGRAANRVAIRVDAGVSVTARTLTFNSNLPKDQRPAGYKNSPVPGARVEGAVFPFALGNPNSALAGLGLAGMYDRTLLLSLKNSAQPGTTFAANAQRYEIGPRFRYVFGSSPTSPSVTFGVDYGHRTFKIDRSKLMAGNVIDVPDVDYRGWTPSLELRVPLAPAIALVFGGGSMLLTSAGSIQSRAQYGRAKVTEGEAHLALDIVLGKRFALTFSGEFAQVGFQFTGNGELAVNRDGNPMSVDVGGAADRYIGGAATFDVLY